MIKESTRNHIQFLKGIETKQDTNKLKITIECWPTYF